MDVPCQSLIEVGHLVIFDCDGVLVDSERLAAQVFSETLAGYGANLSATECLRHFKGLTLQACLERVNQLVGSELPTVFLSDLERATRSRFSRELKAVTGVRAVLECLGARGVAYCVASNGGLAKIENSLATVNLAAYFRQSVFSAQMVRFGKPEPDLFLYAAKTMGYAAQNCWVVEDSQTGLDAALAAGMRVMFYQPEWPAIEGQLRSQDSGRVVVISSMNQLRRYIVGG